MRERKWTVWGLAAVWVAVAACSKQPSDKKQSIAQEGPPPAISWRESPERAERAPISLTASDGSGLALVALDARTVIEDPLAFTELHLTFRNPEPRRREGRFEITLPKEAAISRFAMETASGLQEGEVIERRRAQQVYEDFLHRKQDPALLEKDAGNEFAARVFPIEPNADKKIIIAYSEELAARDRPYRILLAGLPRLERIAIDVRLGSNSATGEESTERARGLQARLQLAERDFVPAGDVEVMLPRQKQVALRSGNLLVARVAPVLPAEPAPIDGLTVLFDTSASRALGYGAQIERLSALCAALAERGAKDFELRVLAFDQETAESYRGPVSGFGLRDKSKLLERDALGASDLAQALAFLAREPDGHARVLVVSDGVVTAGADDTTALREAVAKLAAHGVRRLDVLAEGGIQDRETLAALTRAGLPQSGLVLEAELAALQQADKLLRSTRDRVEVQIAGASFVYPRALEAVQSGDERLVFAELPEGAPAQIELVGAGAEAFETLEAPRPLLERALARAKIAALSGELRALRPEAAEARARLEQQIVALSVAQRVVSDYTALLVLESEWDYKRFGIAQNALTSILRVGDEGIELFDRKRPDDPAGEPRPIRVAVAEGAAPVERDQLWDDKAPEPEPPADQVDLERRRGGDGAPGALAEQAIGALGRASATAEAKGAGASQRTRRAESPQFAAAPPPAKAKKEAESFARAEPPQAAKPASPPAPAPAARAIDIAQSAAPARPASGSANEAIARRAPKASSAADSGEALAGAASGGAPYPLRHEREPELAIAAPALEPHANVRLLAAAGLPSAQAAQALRSGLTARARACYGRAAVRGAGDRDRFGLDLSISDKGSVTGAYFASGSVADANVRACVLAAANALRFPKPDGGNASVQAQVELSLQVARDPAPAASAARPRPRPAAVPVPAIDDAYTGVLADVLAALRAGDKARALAQAAAAHAADPGDVIALVALGEALEAGQDYPRAARVYGSLIDLFPSRADLRRMAAARLERLPSAGLALAVDSYRRAVEQRPDHPSGPRALAYALWKQGQHAAAFESLERALDRSYRSDRFEGADRILREDLALIGAAFVRADPGAQPRVAAALAARGIAPAGAPSLRFVLQWETDANDVDFHVYDGRGGHAYYMKPKLPSGGALYADITTGYGPECFAIPGRARTFPYVLQAHYYARGPMGYGMGKLQVIEHDGQGGLKFAEHPFVIMKDKAFVELARLSGPIS